MAQPPEVRFWAKVERRGDSECWPWRGPRDQHGYGHLLRGGKGSQRLKAHRYSVEIASGKEPPPDLVVMHTCDNPNCVNPQHLKLGTQKDNMADCARKGRTGPRRVSGEQNPSAKLKWDQVRKIRQLHKTGASKSSIAREYGVDRSTIYLITTNKKWKEHA